MGGFAAADCKRKGWTNEMADQGRTDRTAWDERALLQATLSSVGDAVIATDASGSVRFLNPVAQNLTGWTQEEAAGQPLDAVFRIVNEDTRRPVENPATRALREGTVVGLANHTILIARDGTERAIEDSAASIRDDAGRVGGCVLVFRDITERRKAERAVQDALAYAEAIVATVREPLVVLDGDLRVRTANRSFYSTFRVRPEDTEGQLLYDLGNRQWAIPALRKLLEDVLPQNTAFNDFSVEHEFPSIGRKVMLLNARKLFRQGNHSELILLAIEDVTALREEQWARREAEVRFTEMVKNVRDHSIFLTDPDGVITSWNVAAERIIGYSEAEAVGQHSSLIFTPEDVEAGVPEGELRQAREEGRAEDERWHRRKDGSRFWALGIVTPLHDPQGGLSGYSKILRDMTEWKRADEALRERQRQLEFVTDHAPVLLAQVDADRRFKFVNKPYAGRLGLHPRDVVGRHVRDVIGGEAYARIEPHVEAALRGERVEYEADVPYAGIGTQTMRVAYEPERDEEGRVVGYVAAILNISDRKKAEEQLAASRQRLQALFDNALDAILVADDQARYVDANPAASTLLGYGREELLRRGVFDVTPTPNGEAGRAAWAAFVRDGHQSGEYALRRRDGLTAVVEYRAVANVQPGLHLSVLRDVTERRRTEQALKESRERLVEAQRIAGLGSWDIDWKTKAVRWSDEMYRLFGVTPDQFRPSVEGFFAAVPAEDRPAIERAVADALAGKAPYRVDHRIVWPDGTVRVVSEQAEVAFDATGQPARFVGTMLDVTERRAAVEALRVSEARFARFMQHLPGLAWVKDAQGRYVYANDAASKTFGKPPEELYGRTDEEVFPPATAAQFRENDHKALAGGAGVRVVETLQQEDGVLHHSLVSKFPIPGTGGGTALVGGMAIDITEEVRTRAVLQESEERFRATFDQAAVGIAHVGPDGRWLRVNRKLCDILGYAPDELMGLTFQDVTHPDDLEADLAQVRRLAAGEVGTYSLEKRYVRKDRSPVWANLTVSLVRTPEGQPKYFISVVEDVTEKRRVQDALRDSEQRLRSLSDNLPQGAVYQVLGDREGRRNFLYISAGVERLFGVTPAEAVADAGSLYGLVHEEDRARVAAAEQVALRGGTPFDCEFRSRTRSGGLVWVHARSAPRPLPTGQAVWEGIVMDVTARKAAERESEVSRGRLDLVVNSVDVGLWYCDLPFDRLAWNAKVKEHFGLPPDAGVTIGTFYDRLHPDDRERTREAIERSIRDRTPYDVEYRTAGLDGRERWVRAIGRAFYAPSGEPASFDGVTVDVTERVRQEQALKDADRRKDEFLATLAHELRNPLAPLRNGLQVMKLAAGDAGAVEQARTMMERQLGQMVHLIDDLLDVSRISRGKLTLRKERVALAAVVQSAVEGSRPLIEASAHRLAVALPPDPVWLEADPTRLAQVFSNLLTNAAKYTDRGGHIALTAERQGDDVVVSVRDTGIGIAPEHLPRLFEMFSQVDTALERSQGGLGIGLALVKGLVTMHGGSIEARSEGLGKGSEFTVCLPVAGGSTAPETKHPRGDQTAVRPRRRVLVADDNRDAADSLAMMLRLHGHEVHAVHDGQEAVDAAGWFRPDLALLDIGMPRLNGFEACRRIREQTWGRGVVLVAVTGWGQEEDKRRATEAGFDHHLTKPADPAALERLLASSETLKRKGAGP